MWTEPTRISAAELIRGKLQLRVRHLRRDAGLETRRDSKIVGHVLRVKVELKGQPKIARGLSDKTAPDDPHDQVRLALKLDIAADDVGVTAEAALP